MATAFKTQLEKLQQEKDEFQRMLIATQVRPVQSAILKQLQSSCNTFVPECIGDHLQNFGKWCLGRIFSTGGE